MPLRKELSIVADLVQQPILVQVLLLLQPASQSDSDGQMHFQFGSKAEKSKSMLI